MQNISDVTDVSSILKGEYMKGSFKSSKYNSEVYKSIKFAKGKCEFELSPYSSPQTIFTL